MKRIIRKQRLTPEEAAKYKAIREQVAEELPDLIGRHHERSASLDQLQELLQQLKASREAKGLSLADLTELTGMDRSALSKLETGQRANPTVETLVRYAEAVGKRLVVSLMDQSPTTHEPQGGRPMCVKIATSEDIRMEFKHMVLDTPGVGGEITQAEFNRELDTHSNFLWPEHEPSNSPGAYLDRFIESDVARVPRGLMQGGLRLRLIQNCELVCQGESLNLIAAFTDRLHHFIPDGLQLHLAFEWVEAEEKAEGIQIDCLFQGILQRSPGVAES